MLSCFVVAVPGTCPVLPTAAECPPEPEHECREDADCAKLHPGTVLKCCLEGCDNRCVRKYRLIAIRGRGETRSTDVIHVTQRLYGAKFVSSLWRAFFDSCLN
ncbi:MAG: hypothetical protein DSY43_01860 [Gammaproteobacteria bacterium]|nr:MAG: hypothetical protein DSY43_01860 [Gammaproteobacteria bacterium]